MTMPITLGARYRSALIITRKLLSNGLHQPGLGATSSCKSREGRRKGLARWVNHR